MCWSCVLTRPKRVRRPKQSLFAPLDNYEVLTTSSLETRRRLPNSTSGRARVDGLLCVLWGRWSFVRAMLPSGGMADDFELLDKGDLYDLATKLLVNDRDAISKCVEFVLTDTKGLWHGRARAKMCRRLKHCELSKEQQAQRPRPGGIVTVGALFPGRVAEVRIDPS
jgi:hypothetical protein